MDINVVLFEEAHCTNFLESATGLSRRVVGLGPPRSGDLEERKDADLDGQRVDNGLIPILAGNACGACLHFPPRVRQSYRLVPAGTRVAPKVASLLLLVVFCFLISCLGVFPFLLIICARRFRCSPRMVRTWVPVVVVVTLA